MTPSAAVTVRVNSLSPVVKPVSPVTSKVAFSSVVSTKTSTELVKGGSSRTEPSVTSSPLTWNMLNEVSSSRATFKVITYSIEVTPSAAVTTMDRVFSPT